MAGAPTDEPIQALACGILAGGASRRMGRDKAWLELAGEPLLVRIARVLADVGFVFVAVGHEQRRLPELAEPVEYVTDPVADQGPIAGLVAIAGRLPEHVTRVFVCGCDLPFVTTSLIRMLDERWQARGGDAVVPEVGGRLQPLMAVYGRRALTRIAAVFAGGSRRLTDVIELLGPDRVTEAELVRVDPELDAFLNLNRPEDYARALTRLDRGAPRG